MRVLIFDTETTGFPSWSKPSTDPIQPHICQFSGMIVDHETKEELEYVNLIVRPDGWVIPDEVAKLHGITMERAFDEGVPERVVVSEFVRLASEAQRVAAYGVSFDMRIMRIAMLRTGMSHDAADLLANSLDTYCVQTKSTPVAKVPPTEKMRAANRTNFKTPNLAEAVKHILGETMEDAHDARVDLHYTAKLYFFLTGSRP